MVVLDEGSYTIIAHGRVFTNRGEIKYDIARALKRVVVPPIVDVVVLPRAMYTIQSIGIFGLVFDFM